MKILFLTLICFQIFWFIPVTAGGEEIKVSADFLDSLGRKLVDINTATPEELDELPGIGKAYTRAIIDGRPYKNKKDLLRKKIIPRSTYKKIENRIYVSQKARG